MRLGSCTTYLTKMKKLYSNPILFTLFKTITYSAILILIWYLMLLDSRSDASLGKFSENSFTEITQELFLLISAVIYGTIAFKFPKVRGLAILMTGLCLSALVREYNNYFHSYFRGFWQLLVTVILVITAWIAYKNKDTIEKPLRSFLKKPAFGITLSAFLIIMVFSRFYGLHAIWENILEAELQGLYREVKNASEEGIELLGYTMLLFGSIEYFFLLHKKQLFPKVKPKEMV